MPEPIPETPFPCSAGGKFEEVKMASDKEGHWRVEEEFIEAIRGFIAAWDTAFVSRQANLEPSAYLSTYMCCQHAK